MQARVDKVGLPLDFARAEVGHQAVPLHELHAEQADLLALPEAELAAGKVGIVENGIKPFATAVGDVVVARCIKV